MKKLLFLLALISFTTTQAQTKRNDSYISFGALTSFKEIPFGVALYTVEKDQTFGFFTELKWNRLSFDDDYTYYAAPEQRDALRLRTDEGIKNLVKMINIGAVFNPQQVGVMEWDFIDIDFCLGLGYIQDFRYHFYNDYGGIEENEEEGINYASPLGKYYVNSFNQHGMNLNIGTNLSFQRRSFMIHIGYDLKPNTFALGINWKVK